MPTEARGKYLPEAPYLRETNLDLSKLYACERVDTRQWHSQPLESTRHAGNYFVPISIRTILFFVAEVMSSYLTTDGLEKFSLLPEAPLRPVAFATFATWFIRHWSNRPF